MIQFKNYIYQGLLRVDEVASGMYFMFGTGQTLYKITGVAWPDNYHTKLFYEDLYGKYNKTFSNSDPIDVYQFKLKKRK